MDSAPWRLTVDDDSHIDDGCLDRSLLIEYCVSRHSIIAWNLWSSDAAVVLNCSLMNFGDNLEASFASFRWEAWRLRLLCTNVSRTGTATASSSLLLSRSTRPVLTNGADWGEQGAWWGIPAPESTPGLCPTSDVSKQIKLVADERGPAKSTHQWAACRLTIGRRDRGLLCSDIFCVCRVL